MMPTNLTLSHSFRTHSGGGGGEERARGANNTMNYASPPATEHVIGSERQYEQISPFFYSCQPCLMNHWEIALTVAINQGFSAADCRE